jgi:hypothetical protein
VLSFDGAGLVGFFREQQAIEHIEKTDAGEALAKLASALH